MSRGLVVLDRHHRGKPLSLRDWGAGSPVGFTHTEGYHTGILMVEADAALSALGWDVICITDGRYDDRHRRVNGYRADVYVALHMNAGGGDYSAAFYDHRTRKGQGDALAGAISRATQEEIGVEGRAISAKPGDWTRNAYATIDGVSCPAVCWEPLFLDNPNHQCYLGPWGISLLANALAKGITNYADFSFEPLP